MRVFILGAGLSGLTTAYLLKKEGIQATIVEARKRIGGRIWTQRIVNNVPVEAGATWFGMKHSFLHGLLQELGVGYFPQVTEGISLFETMSFAPVQQFTIPADEPESFRIKGGSSALIEALVNHIDSAQILSGKKVHRITCSTAENTIITGDETFIADVIINTLPPRLFVNTIKVTPSLPDSWVQVGKETHTWMADSIKFFVVYKTNFWAERSFSGTAFSQSGIIPEMYDHSTEKGHSLKGFLSPHAYKLSDSAREQAVIKQLTHYFGNQAKTYIEYGDVLWRNEPFTRVPSLEELLPHQNNGHPLLREPLFERRLFMGGSETADAFPGYMDGAVNAAYRVVKEIKEM